MQHAMPIDFYCLVTTEHDQLPWLVSTAYPSYRRFQFTFQDAVAKFVPKFPITFRSSEVGRELRNELPNFEMNFRTSI